MQRIRTAFRISAIATAIVLVIIAWYGVRVERALHAHVQTQGSLRGAGLIAPVIIRRDARGVPHIAAHNEHDLFFAQGFAEGQDRLFQLDLLRRAVYGRLSEVFGKATLAVDENARNFDVRGMVARQWSALAPNERANVQAFADGINAAARTSPTPVEFRLGLYSFEAWKPQDSLAVGMATVIDLTDTWDDILPRHGRNAQSYDWEFPLSDPCFDAPTTDGLSRIGPGEHCPQAVAMMLRELRNNRTTFASNEWVAGSQQTSTHRALLANDPHLRLMIPGIWYLAELRAPGYHAAGATLAGTPGIILGHSAGVAWGATNGTVSSMSIYRMPTISETDSHWVTEHFHIRFGGIAIKKYYRDPEKGIFSATARTWVAKPGAHLAWMHPTVFVRWPAYEHPQSPLPAFDSLDRAATIKDAIAALRIYPGPTQNFVLADTSGRAAYQLAGDIPNDPAWARYVHAASSLHRTFANVPFNALPRIAPSVNTIAWTANNKMYGPEYHLRLSPQFAPPYRAYRIAQLLRAKKLYDVAYFAHMQMDTTSVLERELGRAVARSGNAANLANWNGRITPQSRRATAIIMLRRQLATQQGGAMRARIFADAPHDASYLATIYTHVLGLPNATQRWGTAGAVTVRHAFANLGISWFNGTTFAGNGDSFTVHVQKQGFSQSFHAVWDVGNWDAGGITIPEGESGRPGSTHYTDEASAWVAGKLLPLPFSRAAVTAATKATLVLRP